MKWRRTVPTAITLSILLFGFHSVLRSIGGEFVAAAQLIVLAAILDGLDGEVARLFRGVTTFGAKLDTYVDIVTFGVAPAILVYQVMWIEHGFWGTALVAAILVSAVVRFARYPYKESSPRYHSFKGLPIPVSAVWMAMFVILTESPMLDDVAFPLQQTQLASLMWVCAIAFLLLQVSNVRYAKPTKEMIGLGLLVLFMLILVFGRPELTFCLASCAALLLFAFAGPLYVNEQLADEETEEEAPVEVHR